MTITYEVTVCPPDGQSVDYEIEADTVGISESLGVVFHDITPDGGKELVAFFPLNNLVSVMKVDPEEETGEDEPMTLSNGKRR